MKRITRVISAIAGAITSMLTVGCMKPAGDVYGPPDSFDRYRETADSDLGNKGADVDNKQENEVKPEFPESEEPPKKIYGPPEMLDGDDSQNMIPPMPEPAPIYGPPEMLEGGAPSIEPPVAAPVYGPPEMLNGNSRAIGAPKADGIPTTKYGPLVSDEMVALYGVPSVPVVPSVPPAPPASPDNMVPELQDTEDDADSEANKKDFETLKDINNYPREGKKYYGPPEPRRDR